MSDWPSYEDVSISLLPAHMMMLAPEEFGVLVRLIWAVACASVNGRYTDASPSYSLPNDDKVLARLAGASPKEWEKTRDAVLPFFVKKDGRLYLADDNLVRISRPATRTSIPGHVKAAVMARDGRRCVYCGDTEGPFHFDHMYPVSRGGSNDPANIVVSCQACNLSKSDRTIVDWVAVLRGNP